MSDTYSTLEVARLLGLAVRSVQLMVDRGELAAWKTPGGHRRILRDSVERWRAERGLGGAAAAGTGAKRRAGPAAPAPDARPGGPGGPGGSSGSQGAASRPPGAAPGLPGDSPGAATAPVVLLIEDSRHFQNLISLLVRQHFPGVDLQVADDGIAGLAMAGRLRPQVLIVDILLPGIDGAALIGSLRQHPQFAGMQLVVVTSLDEAERAPYAFALQGVPVVHKPRLVAELPPLLRSLLAPGTAHA